MSRIITRLVKCVLGVNMSANLEIVECVPNFCEGRDKAVIKAIGDAIQETSGCTMLDVATGSSTNRTIYTFVGSPKAVLEGAMNAAIVAHGRIDMAKHIGENVQYDMCAAVSFQIGGVAWNSRSTCIAMGVPIICNKQLMSTHEQVLSYT